MNIFIFILSICFLFLLSFSDLIQSSNRSNGRNYRTKSHKQHKISKQHRQVYGVSRSSITGFEKPMFPPRVINNDLPWDVEEQQRGVINLEIDLLSRRKSKYIVPSAHLNSNGTWFNDELLRPTLNCSLPINYPNV